jgi:hypothetical protein
LLPAMASPGTTAYRVNPRHISACEEFTPLSERRCGHGRLRMYPQHTPPEKPYQSRLSCCSSWNSYWWVKWNNETMEFIGKHSTWN